MHFSYLQATRRTRSFQLGSDQERISGKFKSNCTCINYKIYAEGIEHILRKKTLVQHRCLHKELVLRKLINPHSKHVCSACLAFENHRQFDVSINYDNEEENLEEQVQFNGLNDSETTELIETIEKVSNFLQN